MHIPVLIDEIIDFLQLKPEGLYLDGTLGSGGYSERILLSESSSRVLGLDLDPEAIRRSTQKLESYGLRFKALHAGFHEAKEAFHAEYFDGIVLDLGISSDQIDSDSRGFSFRFDSPLDMRFNPEDGQTALNVLKEIPLKKLEEILATYGEERYCRKIARGIKTAVQQGKIETTKDLASVVERIIGGKREKIHPATRTFQALRIFVNGEMDNLNRGLSELPTMLNAGGRMCVVSYHSLEDRLVKNSFKALSKSDPQWELVTPKPVVPSLDERRRNPRSRSAKLRVLGRRVFL